MSDLVDDLRTAIAVPCVARGGFGSAIRRLQGLIQRAAGALETGLMNSADIRRVLSQKCDEVGGQAAWARAHGIPQSVVSDVLRGDRDPSERLANALGYLRSLSFQELPK